MLRITPSPSPPAALAVLLAVALAAPAAAQAPVLEPVLEPVATLPGDLAPVEAGGAQVDPYVAPGGPGSLAVWVDHRAEFDLPLAGDGGVDVYALRLDADGAPLDATPLRMPRAVGTKVHPKAAWNGSSWLVTWENQQPLSSSPHFTLVLAARVAGDGTLLDETPIVVVDDLGTTGSTTAVASDGDGWVVVAQGTETHSGRVVGVRLDAHGTVLDPGGIRLVDLAFAINRPDLEFANGNYLLVWASGTVRGLRFGSSLTPLGTHFAIGTGSSSKGRVATDGRDFLVVWENTDFGANVRARLVNGVTGALSEVVQVTPLSNFEVNREPDVAWSGGLWHVAFLDTDEDVYRDARITPELVLLDFEGVVLPFGEVFADGRLVVAGVSAGVTAVFERTDASQPWPGEIRASRVGDDLAVGPEHAVSLSASRQGFPHVAAAPGQFLAVFQAEEGGATTIEAQRLDAFGAALDTEPIELVAGARFGKPAVAWNGEVYLVVWEDLAVPFFETDDSVLGLRVAPDGTCLDASPFVVMEGSMPAVAAQGETFLVVASDAPSTDELRYVFAQRVAGDGALVGPAEQVSGSFSRHPEVAPLGSGWVVIWQRNFSHDNPKSVVDAALVGADGAPGATFPVAGVPGFGGAAWPDVASKGDEALLVWQDASLGVAARRLSPSGLLQGALQVAGPPALPGGPVAVWNGEEYAVAWADYRGLVGLFDYRADVHAARVLADGSVLDPGGGFPVAAGNETEFQPAVAGAQGATLYAFVELLPDEPHTTLRVRTRRESPWADEGGAVGPAAGPPLLLGQGDLVPGGAVAFHVLGAPASALGAHVIGASAIDLPFNGGVLVPAPDVLVAFAADPSGSLSTPLAVPPTLPSGTPIHVQSWVFDPGAPFGVSGTNAVGASAP